MRKLRRRKKTGDGTSSEEEETTEDEEGMPAPSNRLRRSSRTRSSPSEESTEDEETPAPSNRVRKYTDRPRQLNREGTPALHPIFKQKFQPKNSDKASVDLTPEDTDTDEVDMNAFSRAFNNMCSPTKRETRLQAIKRRLNLPTLSPMSFAKTCTDYDMGPMDLSLEEDFRPEDHVLGDTDGLSEGTFEGWGDDDHEGSGDDDAARDMSISPMSSPIQSHPSPLFSPIESHPSVTANMVLNASLGYLDEYEEDSDDGNGVE